MLPLFALSQSHQRFVARTAHWPLTQNSLTSSSEVRPCHLACGCGVCLPGPPLTPIGSAERGGPKRLLELRVGYLRSRQRASALTLMTTKKNTLGERLQMASQWGKASAEPNPCYMSQLGASWKGSSEGKRKLATTQVEFRNAQRRFLYVVFFLFAFF